MDGPILFHQNNPIFDMVANWLEWLACDAKCSFEPHPIQSLSTDLEQVLHLQLLGCLTASVPPRHVCFRALWKKGDIKVSCVVYFYVHCTSNQYFIHFFPRGKMSNC